MKNTNLNGLTCQQLLPAGKKEPSGIRSVFSRIELLSNLVSVSVLAAGGLYVYLAESTWQTLNILDVLAFSSSPYIG